MVSFNFAKILQSPYFVVGTLKNFKLLTDNYFDSGFQNIALSSLQLFSRACYEVDLDDIQWNEVATSMASNFNDSWL